MLQGYSIRTSNEMEMTGSGGIGELWHRFLQEDSEAKIPDRVDRGLVVVYSDYASDEKGEFTYLLGARVSSVDHLPAGMSYSRVADGRYAVVTTRVGPLVNVLQEEWKRIWSDSNWELGGQRAFVTDYEVYDARSMNRERAQVEIHVGIRE